MKFESFQTMLGRVFAGADKDVPPAARYETVPVETLHPLVLAYIGDAYFSLYVRTKMLNYEQNKVHILHSIDAKIVSASMQAVAYRGMEAMLTEEEVSIAKRGRNAKSTVPKSATVAEYRSSTGFETLLGYLYLKENHTRLDELTEKAFALITAAMADADKNSGGKS